MIENTVKIRIGFTSSHILFDRFNPEIAIKELNKEMHKLTNTNEQNSDRCARILGGTVLWDIISKLSNENQK